MEIEITRTTHWSMELHPILTRRAEAIGNLRELDVCDTALTSTVHRLLAAHLRMSLHVAWPYLSEVPAERLLERPHPLCNSINWQLGHLIYSEHEQITTIAPPESNRRSNLEEWCQRFEDVYRKPDRESELPACKTPESLATQADLRLAFRQTRTDTVALLRQLSARELAESTKYDYAPTKAAVFQMISAHWLLHSSQWFNCAKPNSRHHG